MKTVAIQVIQTPEGDAIQPAKPLPTKGIVRIECDGEVYRCYEDGDE